MNISKKLKGLLAACVAAVGLTAFAEPTVTVDTVETYQPWSKIAVFYTLGGVDAATDYKVAFDVTAVGQTASVTNDAAKLTDGAQTPKEINTVELFGKEVTDTKAKVKVSLIAVKPKGIPVGQLWEGGPIWAEANLGATKPEEYGILTNFNDAAQAVTDALGKDWRLPTKEEFEALCSNCEQKWDELNGVTGRFFTGKGDYASHSIFLPAAFSDGDHGCYWSSSGRGAYAAWGFYFRRIDFRVDYFGTIYRYSVRAVR